MIKVTVPSQLSLSSQINKKYREIFNACVQCNHYRLNDMIWRYLYFHFMFIIIILRLSPGTTLPVDNNWIFLLSIHCRLCFCYFNCFIRFHFDDTSTQSVRVQFFALFLFYWFWSFQSFLVLILKFWLAVTEAWLFQKKKKNYQLTIDLTEQCQ